MGVDVLRGRGRAVARACGGRAPKLKLPVIHVTGASDIRVMMAHSSSAIAVALPLRPSRVRVEC